MTDPVTRVRERAEPVIERFYDAVVACGRQVDPKPSIHVSNSPAVPHYDHAQRTVVLCAWEFLAPPQRAGMEALSKAGVLRLSPEEQYAEVFNELLVAHELGHWLQMMAMKPIDRWTAEYQANRIMVAFWREHSVAGHSASPEDRFANFSAHGPGLASPIPADFEGPPEEYFITYNDVIEANPRAYAWYQKMMVRRAAAEAPRPSFCSVLEDIWPAAD